VVADPSAASQYALKCDVGNQYWGEYTLPSWGNGGVTIDNFNANDRIEFDAYFPTDGWLNPTAEMRVRFQSDVQDVATSFTAKPISAKDSMAHYAIDYSALPDLTTAGTTNHNLHLY
jgi:hypothetical protein